MDRIAEHILKITVGYGNIRCSINAKDNIPYENNQRRYNYHKLKIDNKKRDLEYIYRKIDSETMDMLGYREVL
ncbi:MAG: hypothetical protein N2B02_06125 [Amylibacter sp.]